MIYFCSLLYQIQCNALKSATLLKMKLLSKVLLQYECVHNSVSRTSDAMHDFIFTWRHDGEMGLIQTNHFEAVISSHVFKVSCAPP